MLDLFFPTVSKRDFIGVQADVVVNPVLLGIPATKREKALRNETEYFPSMLELGKGQPSQEVVFLPSKISVGATSEAAGAIVLSINNVPAFVIHEISGEPAPRKKAESIKKILESLIDEGLATGELTSGVINGQSVVSARGKSIVTASSAEAQIYNTSAAELANRWKASLMRSLMSTPESVVKMVTQEAAPEEFEWESTGTYKLKNTPVVPYSEKITFGGTQLKKFEDYLINYQEGTITLLSPNLPTSDNPLSVTYEYIEVAAESETLPGSGKGPYMLAHEGIIEGSESVYVNNIPYVRELDYSIDYDLGKITFFNAIPQTTNVVVKYRYIVIASTPPPVTPVVPRSLKVGVSYLKESGKRGTEPPNIAATDTFKDSDISSIIKNNYTIGLKNWPVPPDDSGIELKKNDTVMTYGVDYVFPTFEAGTLTPAATLQFINDPTDKSDGFATGTIKYLGTLEANDTITVSYNYDKKATDRYTGTGSSASRRYYLTTLRGVVPGSEIVYIRDKKDTEAPLTTLTRSTTNDSNNFGIDSQYRINYTDTPYIEFDSTKVPLDSINFYVEVKFVAQASVTNREIDHDVLGFNGTYSLGDYVNVQGAFARSKTDQVYNTVSTNETRKGDNVNRSFPLHSQGAIIEDSEQVYLNGNKLNRDSQYSFTYDQPGAIAFSLITPTTLDTISVDYSYQSTSGTITGVNEIQGTALMTGIDVKPTSNIEVAADYKKIDSTFAPMGGTSIPLGSDYEHEFAKITPLPGIMPDFWFSGDEKDYNVPIGSNTGTSNILFLHSTDKNFATGFDPYGIAQFNLGFRDYSTLDDVLPGNLHNNDYKSTAYSLSTAFRTWSWGDYALTTTADGRKTIASTDIVDKVLSTDNIVEYYHTNNAIDLTRRIRWVVDYQVNKPSTISYEAGSRAPSSSKVVAREEVDDLGSNLTWDLTFGGIKRLYTYWNNIGHRDTNFINGTLNSTVNETYHADFVPIDQITTAIDHNRQEIPTITTAFGNPKTEHSSANIKVTPYSTTAFGWSGALDDALYETGIRTSGNSNSYSIDHTAITGPNYKLTTGFSLSNSILKAPSGTEEVLTDTRTFGQNYNITYDPTNVWSVTTGFSQSDYTNKNNSFFTPVDTKSQAQTTSVGTSYKVTEDLDLSGTYSVMVTRVPDISAHKANLDAHAVYKVFTYGTLNYDWSQEENGGEISSGVFSPQDFSKLMQSLSLNIVLPQSGQMILSSIVFKAAVKWASFVDRLIPDNDFKATMLSFEGTFNF